MEESHYLKALEYSSKKPFDGVTFKELRDYIETTFKTKFNAESLISFFKFVLDTHYWSSTQIGTSPTKDLGVIGKFYISFKEELNPGKYDVSSIELTFNQFTIEEKYFLNGEGDKRLLDFYELREARENAQQAYTISIIAMIISILALLLSPLVERIWNYFLCTP
ncbi:hypothetical protein [Aestuariivivens sediminicola]|uniref:hypothetical protein n=1 Tax=Aestuariivivens sediminicola TaxID=2913560 RepID=UPI001F568372|nr:hypothetical protein [Aestuariivivens sediminicola]